MCLKRSARRFRKMFWRSSYSTTHKMSRTRSRGSPIPNGVVILFGLMPVVITLTILEAGIAGVKDPYPTPQRIAETITALAVTKDQGTVPVPAVLFHPARIHVMQRRIMVAVPQATTIVLSCSTRSDTVGQCCLLRRI